MWTHTCKHTHSCHLKSVALQNEHLFMSYEENQCFPVLKEPVVSKVCVCVCLPACLHSQACMFPQSYSSCAALHAWECWRHSVSDNYDDGVCLSAEVEKGRRGLNECSVGRRRERRAKARKREGVRKMESGEEGWIVLCVESERKERASCGMFTCQCSPSSDWSYLCACVWVCVCLCFQMGFHIEILGSPIL